MRTRSFRVCCRLGTVFSRRDISWAGIEMQEGRRLCTVVGHRLNGELGHLRGHLASRGFAVQSFFREGLDSFCHDSSSADLGELVIALGSPWAPLEARPEVKCELELLSAAMDREIPVLGICFGGELIARILGTPVFPLTNPLIGFRPVMGLAVDTSLCFFWNSFGFDPPSGAAWTLPGSESCLLFKTGAAVAVQFHLEADSSILSRWTQESPEEFLSRGVSPAEVLSTEARIHDTNYALAGRILDFAMGKSSLIGDQ